MLARLANLGILRPLRVLPVTLVVFLLAVVIGGPAVGGLNVDYAFNASDAEATQARKQIEQATGISAEPAFIVLVHGRPGSPAVRDAVRTLKADRDVAQVVQPPNQGDSPLRSKDGRSSLLAVSVKANAPHGPIVDRLEAALEDQTAVELGGVYPTIEQINRQAADDLGRAELMAFPILAILALLIFRGIAALLPLAVGGLSVFLTFSLLRLVNEVVALSPFALNLVIGLGIGLAIDYSLFLVSRFREELGHGADVPTAVRTTMATAGVTVIFSALTVAAAMACLCVFPLPFLYSMGIAGVICSLMAAAVSLLVLPSLFVVLGTRLGKVRPRADTDGRWYRLAHAIMRRPGTVALLTAAVMLVLAAPSLRTSWSGVDSSVLPKDHSARTVFDTMARDFPNANSSPIAVAVQAPKSAAAEVRRYAQAAARLPGVEDVAAPRPLGDDVWQIDVDAGETLSPTAHQAVRDLRALPTTHPTLVGGPPADVLDQRSSISNKLPLAIGLLIALTSSLLWLMTGSVILPIKTLIMNLLTTAAATGILVFVFQDGRFTGLLGYTPQGGIEQTDFLVMVAIVFGLSTDYGVFLLTRIKEARDGGLSERESVAAGLQRTGGLITAASLLLAVALGAFITSRMIFLQELGLGAAAAILLDAFLVRTLLVPSLMGLLGRWNWWSPGPLRRLHERIGISEGLPAGVTPAAVVNPAAERSST